MSNKVSRFLDDALGELNLELLKDVQLQTLTSLQEARGLLENMNFNMSQEHQKVKVALEKKVAVLDQMRSDLVHIYSQLSFIEDRVSQLENSNSDNPDS